MRRQELTFWFCLTTISWRKVKEARSLFFAFLLIWPNGWKMHAAKSHVDILADLLPA
jgi:hypothetical protein